MIRKASVMTVYPDKYEEYEKRHDELWPEMKATLKEHGAHNYSIFLEKSTGKLFAYLEVEDEKKYAEIAKTEICQKWWDYMEPLMETNEDNSPVSVDLEEVFHLY
jgi:L-rhamnose mutarotase